MGAMHYRRDADSPIVTVQAVPLNTQRTVVN